MITITEKAAEKIKESLQKRGWGLGVKIGIRTAGCSGLAYTLEYVDTLPPGDDYFCYENHGAQVWTDQKSLVYLDGVTVDWTKKGLNEGFEFINPNSTGTCGCGESFTV